MGFLPARRVEGEREAGDLCSPHLDIVVIEQRDLGDVGRGDGRGGPGRTADQPDTRAAGQSGWEVRGGDVDAGQGGRSDRVATERDVIQF